MWGMSSMLTRPQTPTTKVSTSHSLTPRAMRKWPPSPHAVPQELAAVCRGDTAQHWVAQLNPNPPPPILELDPPPGHRKAALARTHPND